MTATPRHRARHDRALDSRVPADGALDRRMLGSRVLGNGVLALSRRLAGAIHTLQELVAWNARQLDARPSGADDVRTRDNEAIADRRLRLAVLGRMIETAVRHGAIFRAMKYEIARDVDLVREELSHEFDLLIDRASEPDSATDRKRRAH